MSDSGTIHQNGWDDAGYTYHTTATVASGSWVTTGSASATDSGADYLRLFI